MSAGGNITIVGAIGGDGLQDLIVEDAVDVTFHNLVYLEGNISVNATGVISDQGIISNNYVSWELLSGTPDFLPQGPGTTYDSGGIVVGGGPGAVIGGDATEQGPAGETSGAGAEGMIGTPISGAVTAVAVHPINPAIVYIATVNGGIWKTENIEATKAVPLPDIVDQLRDSGPDVVDAGTSATQGANGDLPEGTYRYKITFVNTDLGTESNASLALSVTIENGKRINLTNIPIGPVGTTARKIYRADPGEDTFKQIPDNRLSATLQDNTTRAVTDNVLLANLTDPPMVTVPFPHWKPMTDTSDSLSITTLVLDPLDPIGNTLYAGIGITSSAKVGGNLIGLLKTTDGGETWSVKGGTDLDLRGLKITGIAFASPRLLPLTDLQGMAPDITGLTATAASVADSKLTAGTYQYKITFVDKETGRESLASEPITMALGQGQNQITLNRLPVDPAGGNKARYIYRTTPDGSLFFLVHVENNNNANQNWVNAGPVIDPALLVSTRGAANPAARGGVYRSEDGGETWSRVSDGAVAVTNLPPGDVTDIKAVHNSDPGHMTDTAVLFAAHSGDKGNNCAGAGIYQSNDGGKTWNDITSTRNHFVGNNADTVFNCNFVIPRQEQLTVYVNNVKKTFNTHYTLQNVGTANNGRVTFIAAPANGAAIVVQLNLSPDPITGANFTYDFRTGKPDRIKIAVQAIDMVGPDVNGTSATINPGGKLTAGDYTYRITFLSDNDVESAPSTDVSVNGVLANHKVTLTNLPTKQGGTAARRIYRKVGDGAFTLVATINENTTTTFIDTFGVPVNVSGGQNDTSPNVGTASTAAADSGKGGKLAKGNYTYRITFLSDTGIESAPSADVTVNVPENDHKVTLTNLPTKQGGTAARRIYRKVGDGAFTLPLLTKTRPQPLSTPSASL